MFKQLLANALALAVATWLLPGIWLGAGSTGHRIVVLVVVALLFGLLNSLVKPLVKLVSLPAIVLTLGLFLWVVNALMLLLTSALARGLGQPWHVDGWGPALLGSLVVSLVSWATSGVLREPR